MFLWIVFLSLWGFIFNVTVKNEEILKAKSIGIISFVIVGFLLFLLATSNPFTTILPIAPLNGADINPVLQDPALAIHPPTLYLGYVGFVIPFACAISFLLEGKTSIKWEVLARKWSIAAWVFLTIGITLGSWWAYYELGWGGYWFWDPVENSSLMPWFVMTALLHSILVLERRIGLYSWVIVLSILTFTMSVTGTVLVRSGILNSVHTFASDPSRGLFILSFLISMVFFSMYIFFKFAPTENKKYAILSKETFIIANNWFMIFFLAVVLIGTLNPVYLEKITGSKISVGHTYYNCLINTSPSPRDS